MVLRWDSNFHAQIGMAQAQEYWNRVYSCTKSML
jgi:hypothetical protein